MGTRLMIDSLTCLLCKEADPSRLVATSPCKLVRHLVASGSHVEQDSAYAEVEVMKMMMPLLAPAAGIIDFVLPEGVALAAGDLIANLQVGRQGCDWGVGGKGREQGGGEGLSSFVPGARRAKAGVSLRVDRKGVQGHFARVGNAGGDGQLTVSLQVEGAHLVNACHPSCPSLHPLPTASATHPTCL